MYRAKPRPYQQIHAPSNKARDRLNAKMKQALLLKSKLKILIIPHMKDVASSREMYEYGKLCAVLGLPVQNEVYVL